MAASTTVHHHHHPAPIHGPAPRGLGHAAGPGPSRLSGQGLPPHAQHAAAVATSAAPLAAVTATATAAAAVLMEAGGADVRSAPGPSDLGQGSRHGQESNRDVRYHDPHAHADPHSRTAHHPPQHPHHPHPHPHPAHPAHESDSLDTSFRANWSDASASESGSDAGDAFRLRPTLGSESVPESPTLASTLASEGSERGGSVASAGRAEEGGTGAGMRRHSHEGAGGELMKGVGVDGDK